MAVFTYRLKMLYYEVYFANVGSQRRKYTIPIKDNKMIILILILILIIVMIGRPIVRYQVPVIKQTQRQFNY